MSKGLIYCLTLAYLFGLVSSKISQVHISYGDSPSEMKVVWSSGSADSGSDVQYRIIPSGFPVTATGQSRWFVDQGANRRGQYLHTVVLRNLRTSTSYEYRCGGGSDWSKYYEFRTMDPSPYWVPTIGVFGDLGIEYCEYTLEQLTKEANAKSIDLLLAAGDHAYSLDSNNGISGDIYFDNLEPIIARIPLLAVAGNHETMYNYLHFRERFENPKKSQTNNFYFSVNVGRTHLVLFNIEFYDPTTYEPDKILTQYNWLVADLEQANRPENRLLQPWIVLLEHRPMYCSGKNVANCVLFPDLLRAAGIERLLLKYGVDIITTGHTHNYERTLPVYNHQPRPGTISPYYNPRATIHVVNGAAGSKDSNTNFGDPIESSAFRSKDYGYVRFRAQNSTHLLWEYVSSEQGGVVIDSQWIIQHYHGSFE